MPLGERAGHTQGSVYFGRALSHSAHNFVPLKLALSLSIKSKQGSHDQVRILISVTSSVTLFSLVGIKDQVRIVPLEVAKS